MLARPIVLALLATSFALASCRSNPAPAPDPDPTMAAEAPPRLAPDRIERIDALFAEWDRPDSPGAALAVYRGGEIAYARGYGAANLETGTPIGPATVFDIGSVSKQFTAACVLLLEQDGALILDDDIRTHLPELPDYGSTVTVRQLLHHTGGVPDYIRPLLFRGRRVADVVTERETLEVLGRIGILLFPPGTEHDYSNTGYFLLGRIVERAAGESLADFAERRIFAPLGMRRTHFHGDHTRVVPGRAVGYARREEGGFAIDMSNWEQTGDGAVLTTVEDLALWHRNFSTGEVGGPAFLARMAERGRLGDGTELAYGMGMNHELHRGLPVVHHGGSWAGYRAMLIRFPTEDLGVACLANLADVAPWDRAFEVAAIVLGDRLAPEPEPQPEQVAEDAPESP